MPSEFSQQALSILRDGSQFQWYVIPLLSFVFYVYVSEMEKKNYALILAGLAFWGMDWFNEIINSLIFHFTNFAPLWCCPGDTALWIQRSQLLAYRANRHPPRPSRKAEGYPCPECRAPYRTLRRTRTAVVLQ